MAKKRLYYKSFKQKLNYRISASLFAKLLFGVALIEILVAAIFVLLSTPAIERSIVLATTTKPEKFTELYFENGNSLPNLIKTNQQYSFKFTIHNLENQDMSYPYEVYLQTSTGKLFIDQGVAFIKNGDFQTYEDGFIVNDTFTKGEIVVNLKNKNQQIDFWIKGANEKTR